MIVVMIIMIIALCFAGVGIWGKIVNNKDRWSGEIRMYGGFFLCGCMVLLTITSFLTCLRWQIGTDIKTGFIYSVEEHFGKGTVHLRMSLEAGKDSQEPFCVEGENLSKARELAGSGKKVRVIIPSTNFHFENDFFACTSKVVIEEMEE